MERRHFLFKINTIPASQIFLLHCNWSECYQVVSRNINLRSQNSNCITAHTKNANTKIKCTYECTHVYTVVYIPKTILQIAKCHRPTAISKKCVLFTYL